MLPVILYALLWASFGAGHSLLAGARGHALLARAAGAADRLAYNLIALCHLGLVLGIGAWTMRGAGAFALPAPLGAAMTAMALGGVAILLAGGRGYDLPRFLGLAQLRRGAAEHALGAEPLTVTGLNAWVRHPLYLGLLMLLWGMARGRFALATAILASAYVLIGIRFEEQRLLRLHGAAYRAYRARVPMLLPWKRPARTA
ncbi:MAG: isoprenylcysteine carboxylmethyltransferase family protein [Rhodospirillales bacterium]|nr:isoprenylcysteine carboxylmethyltransferase family protein [Rhodospirillales bacterium]